MNYISNFLEGTIDNLTDIRNYLNPKYDCKVNPEQSKNKFHVSLLSLACNGSSVYFAFKTLKSLLFVNLSGVVFNTVATVVTNDASTILRNFKKEQTEYENSQNRDSIISWPKEIFDYLKSGNLAQYTKGCVFQPAYKFGCEKLSGFYHNQFNK